MRNFSFLISLLLASVLYGAAPDLEIFDGNFPISLYFRQTESTAAQKRLSYTEWSEGFSQMNGVIGKMLEEEVPGRSAAQEYFRRFKQMYPRQAVILHANGGFRKPVLDINDYHDGHWLYYNGATVLDPVSSKDEVITIRVSDPSLFQMEPYRNNPELTDDIGLCAMGSDGKPDWTLAEQTSLLGVDAKSGTITLKRSMYGDRKRHSYSAGKAYVASHAAQNWGTDNKLWEFNMSTACPRDANGRQAADVWLQDLVSNMQPGGNLDYVDGVQFDVPFIIPTSIGPNRQPDCDADGKPDNGYIDGVPVFVHGVDRFFQNLMDKLPDRLIMADSRGRSQRSIAHLNGMEIEGFPELRDPEFYYWSTSINYFRFWAERSRPPRFNYGLMKFLRWPGEPSFSDARLIMAGTTMHDMAVPLGNFPDREPWFVFDEILKGVDKQKGWLGKPIGPVRRLALATPDISGSDWAVTNGSITKSKAGLRFSGGHKANQFSLRGTRLEKEGDLVLAARITAQPRKEFPPGNYRVLEVTLSSGSDLPDCIRRTHFDSPVNEEPFDVIFYFRQVPAGDITFNFGVDGSEDVIVEKISAHACPDLSVREFENGVILANPSDKIQKFDLQDLFPGQNFRRLTGSPDQDPQTNSGKPVSGVLTLNPLDAVFLIKTEHR